MKLLTVDDVAYDAASHTSQVAGRDVPHVTAVLKAVGVSTDFDEIANLTRRAGEHVQAARERGSIVHIDCHAYDDDDLIIESVHPDVKPFVEAWIAAREGLGLVPVPQARERRVFHPIQFYTGIIDGVFMRRGRRALVDVKCGDPEHSACHLQTAAYELAWTFSRPKEPIHERLAVQLAPRLAVPYRVKDYSARPDAAQDYGKWLAALCTYNEQAGRRRRVA